MAIDRVMVERLREQLSRPEDIEENAFRILKGITAVLNSGDAPGLAQELILLALERRDHFGRCVAVLNGLVREVGLFPYLDPDELNLADTIAYEFHRPLNVGAWDVVFHGPQANVYRELLSGRSVILSAPTSFGKSLIIDALIASEKYTNILIIVPTIALIDETRRRLAKFRETYKIITHAFQRTSTKNVFVLTQERASELVDLNLIDFFVLDEFYKLSPDRADDARCDLLNQVFYQLTKRGKQFYMLGPSVNGVSPDAEARLTYTYIQEPYHTVVSRLHPVRIEGDEFTTLSTLARGLVDPTIVFCSSPNRAAAVSNRFVEDGLGQESDAVRLAADWISQNYHPEWNFVRALSRGIGVHHGRIPRALAQYVVRAFNLEHVHYLVCTSTLIEGVNTKAKNIIVFDDTIDRKRFNMFTFNNIRGRSGRMLKHFVGDVYVFHEPPQEGLPLVDFPAISQPPTATPSLLIQLDEDDLSAGSKDRLKRYEEQDVLAYQVLKANVGINLDQQLALAADISANLPRYASLLKWSGYPTWNQLHLACELIWKFFDGSKLGSGSVSNPKQLTFLILKLRSHPSVRELIENQIPYSDNPDKAVSKVLDFLRLWASFQFPRLLRALSRIQAYILRRAGKDPGDYEAFASQVENLFMDPTLIALDEYGIPIQLARKLAPQLKPNGDLDEVLARLKALPLDEMELHPFEHEILRDAQSYL